MTDNEQHPSCTAVLVAELAAEGTVDSRGAFTLDPARARELLAAFRLADPATWAVELIQAAVLLGASRLEAAVVDGRVKLRFDGEPFTREELEQVDSGLLARADTDRQRAVAQLAIALHGAAALPAPEVIVVSGRATLVRRPGEPDHLESTSPESPGTEVIVTRAAEAIPGTGLPEAEALLRLAGHADLDLTVNGVRVAHGPVLPGAVCVEPVTGEGFAGGAYLGPRPERARLVVLQHGVVIAEEAVENAPVGLRVVLAAPGAVRDLGLGRVVEGALLQALRAAASQAVDQVLGAAVRGLAQRPGEPGLDPARSALRSAFLDTDRLRPAQVVDLALWPEIGGDTGLEHVTFALVNAAARSRHYLRYTTLTEEQIDPALTFGLRPLAHVLQVADEAEARAIAGRIGVPAVNLDSLLLPPLARLPGRIWRAVRALGAAFWILAILPVLLLPLARHCYLDARYQQTWPSTTATVVKADWSRHTNNKKTTYRVDVSLRYAVGSRSFVHAHALSDHSSIKAAQTKIAALRAEPRMKVFYDPQDPGRATVKRDDPQVSVVAFGLVSLVCFVVAVILWFVGRARYRALGDWQTTARQEELARALATLDQAHVGTRMAKPSRGRSRSSRRG